MILKLYNYIIILLYYFFINLKISFFYYKIFCKSDLILNKLFIINIKYF